MAQLSRCISPEIRAGGGRVALRCYVSLPSLPPSRPPSLDNQPTRSEAMERKTNMKERYKPLTVFAYQTAHNALSPSELLATEPFGLIISTVKKKGHFSTQKKTFAFIIDGGPHRPISSVTVFSPCLFKLDAHFSGRLVPFPPPLSSTAQFTASLSR